MVQLVVPVPDDNTRHLPPDGLADGASGVVVRQEQETFAGLAVAFDIHYMAASNTVEGLDDGDRKLTTIHLAVGVVSLLDCFADLGGVSLVILQRSEQSVDPCPVSVVQTQDADGGMIVPCVEAVDPSIVGRREP